MQPLHFPLLYEINTAVWLRELAQKLGRPATFDDIPDAELDLLASLGFDWVWLMGIWQTGAEGRRVSRTHLQWYPGYRETLGNDLTEADICGSPFAIQCYEVHADFGGGSALSRLRRRLAKRGLRLMLDFVPNHTALDHPWTLERPEFYIHGTESELTREPGNYYRVDTSLGSLILARGRDPYFLAWPDTLQLNYRHPKLREAMRQELLKIAGWCDGLRCDMAMLILPDIFIQTWGAASWPRDGVNPVDEPFWPEAITHVRRQYQDFLFMAEVYWGREQCLQEQGFDYTYDKHLYDQLRARNSEAIRNHLQAKDEFQRKSARFLENHDEPRAAAVFQPHEVHQAAAIVVYLIPGLRLFHEGQLDGRKIKVSIHLNRRPAEAVDITLQTFYHRLLQCARRPEVRQGSWRLLECCPIAEGDTCWQQFIAFTWQRPDDRQLFVAVNYGPNRGQYYVKLPMLNLPDGRFQLNDLMSEASYMHDCASVMTQGLYVELPGWGYHLFEVSRPTKAKVG